LSHRKDTDYLSISARIRAMENRLLTHDRLDRMIEARDTAEAMKVLGECGYQEGIGLDAALAQARGEAFADMASAAPDPRLVEVFQLKYDYHNAKTILKAQAMGVEPGRLLLAGGRYDPQTLLEGWKRDDLSGCSERFRQAMSKAWAELDESRDPQSADLILDRACYEEMAQLAKELDSRFLAGYVRLSVDVANLRAAVRVHRMGKEGDFVRKVMLPGGNVSEQSIANARGEALGEVFRAGPLAQAAELGASLAQPGAGALTAFERECDNALTAYLSAARRVPFGEETVIGYLYAKEQELTAIRSVFAGRAAGLDGDAIRQRLRETYV
jgi:V/A-type H+-transporting ATPase subunit C